MSGSEKSKKGLIANIRRRTSLKKGNAGSAAAVSVGGDEIGPPQSSLNSGSAANERMAQLEDTRSKQDRERILALEAQLETAREEMQKWEKKAAQYESVGAYLDDDSYDAAQAFQLKKELGEIQKELATHEEMKQELADTKQELSEFRAQNDELLQQQSRKTTRTDIQRIRIEKSTREEVERLHRDLRQMERDAKSQASMVEAQLRASKDSLQRAGEKAQALQRRLDLVDKERLDLKLENQRLSRKLEKADSYAAKKRAQMEAESQEIEISNLKRKTAKLEKRLSMSTMNLSEIDELGPFNISSPPRTDSRLSSDTTSPIPMTLSEAKVENLEKEVHSLEVQNSVLETQNEALKDELSASQQKAMILLSQVEEFQANIGEERQEAEGVVTQLVQYQNAPLPMSNGTDDKTLVHELQQEIAKLKKTLENKDTEMRVRLKEMKDTNAELKREVEELEMERLRLELGEDEDGEGGELTNTEEDGNAAQVTAQETPQADGTEVKTLRERLMSLQNELLFVSQNNDELKTKLDKQKEEADLFMQSIESELTEVQASEEEMSREQKLASRNEELKSKLKEQQDMYNDMIRETSRLKTIIADQEEEILLLKVQKEQAERRLSTRSTESPSPSPSKKEPSIESSPGRKEHTLVNGSSSGGGGETPPPTLGKVKTGKKTGGMQLLPSKKSKTPAPVNEVDGALPSPKSKKPVPSIKKRPPKEWPPKPRK